jgi:hypothetical protein
MGAATAITATINSPSNDTSGIGRSSLPDLSQRIGFLVLPAVRFVTLTAVIAYKFLDGDGRGVFSGFRWTAQPPGTWLEAAAARPCREGIHGCRPADLAWWLNEELWAVELDGDVTEAGRKVVARRGRLRSRVDAWSGGAAAEFVTAVIFRARDAALTIAGSTPGIETLAACRELGGLAPAARDALAALDEGTSAHVAVGLVADAAFFADQHVCHAPFISACAAGHAAAHPAGRRTEWRAGFEAERAWQSRWIAERLELSAL